MQYSQGLITDKLFRDSVTWFQANGMSSFVYDYYLVVQNSSIILRDSFKKLAFDEKVFAKIAILANNINYNNKLIRDGKLMMELSEYLYLIDKSYHAHYHYVVRNFDLYEYYFKNFLTETTTEGHYIGINFFVENNYHNKMTGRNISAGSTYEYTILDIENISRVMFGYDFGGFQLAYPTFLNNERDINNTIYYISDNPRDFVVNYYLEYEKTKKSHTIRFLEEASPYLNKLFDIHGRNILTYTDLLRYYRKGIVYGDIEHWSKRIRESDSIDYHTLSFLSCTNFNWARFYNVLSISNNKYVWDLLLPQNQRHIQEIGFYPENIVDKSELIDILNDVNIEIIAIYNGYSVSEVNQFISERLKSVYLFSFRWYFVEVIQKQLKYPIHNLILCPYSFKQEDTDFITSEWTYNFIKEKELISLSDETTLYDSNFNLFAHLYLQSEYNLAIEKYCRNYNIDIRFIPRWKSEYNLYLTIKTQFQTKVFYQYSPNWLGRQIFDIYLPEYNIAIEYQGIQHFESIEYFGGKDGLNNTKERDSKKKILSDENGCTIIYHRYDIDYKSTVLKLELLISEKDRYVFLSQ
jgi:hypothetical protein